MIIYGDGNLEINEDPGILRINPTKLILVGAAIIYEPSAQDGLYDAMCRTENWINIQNNSSITTIADALNCKVRIKRRTNKPYHTIYTFPLRKGG